MWFRNLIVLRVPAGWDIDVDTLADALLPQAFTEATSVEETRLGWVPPREGDTSLVYANGRQMLIAMRQEKKLLPARVVTQFVKQRASA
jgi:recombination associated protein RdgC